MKRCAALLLTIWLMGCDRPAVVTAVGDFCTRVDRFHATDAEREFLKVNGGPLERLIRWVAGINKQWDDECLKPVQGP